MGKSIYLGWGDRSAYKIISELGISKRFYAELYNVTTDEIDTEVERIKLRKARKKKWWQLWR